MLPEGLSTDIHARLHPGGLFRLEDTMIHEYGDLAPRQDERQSRGIKGKRNAASKERFDGCQAESHKMYYRLSLRGLPGAESLASDILCPGIQDGKVYGHKKIGNFKKVTSVFSATQITRQGQRIKGQLKNQ